MIHQNTEREQYAEEDTGKYMGNAFKSDRHIHSISFLSTVLYVSLLHVHSVHLLAEVNGYKQTNTIN